MSPHARAMRLCQRWYRYVLHRMGVFNLAAARGGAAPGADPAGSGWRSIEPLEPRVLLSNGGLGSAAPLNTPEVIERHLFFNNSFFDDGTATPDPADDAAIAPGKQPLLPGIDSGNANYSNYLGGINGIFVDIADLPEPDAIDAADFQFSIGNNADPTTWTPAPAPSHVEVRPGAGAEGSDRIALIWPDGAIVNTWMQIRVLAGDTGLPSNDVFYFGNAIGDTFDNPDNLFVDGSDLAGVRDNPRDFTDPADTTSRFDVNRDRFVDGTDFAIARDNPTDFATDVNDILIEFTAPRVTSVSPAHGETMVNVARETIVRFDRPVDPDTVDSRSLQLLANGEAVSGEIVVNRTGEKATFFYDQPLPASTEVRVIIDGNAILGMDGQPLDADNDRVPGGRRTADFRTLPVTRIAGTELFGFVRDSQTGAPLEGVEISLDAYPQVSGVTDATGFFELGVEDADGDGASDGLPAPRFFAHIDGSNVTNQGGQIYASLGKPFGTTPGERQQLTKGGQTFDIYLPPVASDATVPLQAGQETDVGFGPSDLQMLGNMFPDVDMEMFEAMEVTIPDGAAVNEQGEAASEAFVVPVDPDFLPAPLPSSVDPELVISVQTPGATNFDIPAPVTFPNLEGLPLGARPALLSFDHDKGAWEEIGTGTVVENPDGEGTVIESDPGVGILAPGWHYTSPPLNWVGAGGPPAGNDGADEMIPPEYNVRLLSSGDTDTIDLSFNPPTEGEPPEPGEHEEPEEPARPSRKVDITVSFAAQLNDFYINEGDERIRSESFVLRPGDDPINRSATLRTLDQLLDRVNGGDPLLKDRLYGATIEIDELLTRSDGSTVRSREVVAPFLLVDQSDDDPTDGVIRIPDTVVANDAEQVRKVEFGFSPGATLEFIGPAAGDYRDATEGMGFDPTAAGPREATLGVGVVIDGEVRASSSGPTVMATGTEKQKLNISRDQLEAALGEVGVEETLLTTYTSANQDESFNLMFNGESGFNVGYDAEAGLIEESLELFLPEDEVTVRKVDSTTDSGVTLNEFEIEFSGSLQYTDGTVEVDFRSGGQAQATARRISKAETEAFDTEAERQAISQSVMARVEDLFNAVEGVENAFEVFTAPKKADDEVRANTSRMDWKPEAPREGLYGTSEPDEQADGVDVDAAIAEFAKNHEEYTPVVQNFMLDRLVNQSLRTRAESYTDSQLEIHDLTDQGVFISDALVNTFTKTAAHEAGHVLGGRHTFLKHDGNTYETLIPNVDHKADIMAQGADFQAADTFLERLTANVLQLGLNVGWDMEDGQRALANYAAHYAARSDGFNAAVDADAELIEDTPIEGRALAVFDEDDMLVPGTFGFGNIEADGAGGADASSTFNLMNFGGSPLTINDVRLRGGSDAFELGAFTPGAVLESTDVLPIDITVDPAESQTGDLQATLVIDSDDETTPVREIDLTAFGLDPDPSFVLSIGGVALGETATRNAFFEVRNVGAQPLSFMPTVTTGRGDFDLGPNGGVAQTLDPGAVMALPLSFAPSDLGLRSAMIEFVTNDPDQPDALHGAVGSGIPVGGIGPDDFDWGNDFITVETDLTTDRLRSNNIGGFDLGIDTDTPYSVAIFDPDSGYIADSDGTTGPSGAFTDITSTLRFEASVANDTDFDGLPDDVEHAIGVNPSMADSDGDGIDDSAEIEQGLDPLGGRAFPTGVIASLPLDGEANDLVVVGSTDDPTQQTAYVATGSHGLALVDASAFNNPIVLGQLELAGVAEDVDVDPRRALAAVATGEGLHIIDVALPMTPTLERTIVGGFDRVEVADGIAYAAGGQSIQAFDLATGHALDDATLAEDVTGMSREGAMLYTMDVGRNLRAFDIGGPDLAPRGAIQLPDGGGKLFVGNGIAYAAAATNGRGGFATADVSDPDDLQVLSGSDATGDEPIGPRADIAVNGSGLATLVGFTTIFADDFDSFLPMDVADPQQTNEQGTGFTLPGRAQGVALASGIAYVADESAGLQVVNYLSFDASGQPPTVDLAAEGDAVDLEPGEAGIQMLEGGAVPFTVDATDDVQVRNVELLVNGQAVQNAVSFPFDLSAIAPVLAEGETSGQFTVQARATDTGGNTALSDALTIEIQPDTTPPTVDRFGVEVTDADAGAPGVQVLESADIRVRFAASDFGGLDSVDLLRDGAVVATQDRKSGVFTLLPDLLADGQPSRQVELSVRANDAADNSTTAAPFHVEIVPDTTEPTVSEINLADGDTKLAGPFSLNATFSEPIDPATLTLDRFSLTGPDDEPIESGGLLLLNDDDLVRVAFEFTEAGPHRLTIDARGITDRAANPLGPDPLEFDFVVTPDTTPLFAGQRFPVGQTPLDVISADFNNDGLPDMATANVDSDDVAIRLGQGNGSLGPVQRFDAGDEARALTSLDLNNDGALDLAVANVGAEAATLLVGNGDGTFNAPQQVDAGYAADVTRADFDGDGNADLARANYFSDDVEVLLGNGDGTFDPGVRFDSGEEPRAVTAADFDGDGSIDLATANSAADSVSLFIGDGDGGFGAAQDLSVGDRPEDVIAADADNDGSIDLATANAFSDDVSLLTGDGNGGFAAEQRLGVGQSPEHLSAGDVDGDGLTDLATANRDSDDVSVLVGRDDASPSAEARFIGETEPTSIAAADLNGDGRDDLITAGDTFNVGLDGTTVLLGDAEDTLTSSARLDIGYGAAVARGDFNGDGLTDLAAANDFADSDVSILLGNGDGTFQAKQRVATGDRPRSILVADIDGDGHLDLLTGNYGNFAPGGVSLLLGGGDGTFQLDQSLGMGDSPRAVAAADFNDDGHLDLASANSQSDNVSIRLNDEQGGFPSEQRFDVGIRPLDMRAGDFNGDDLVDLLVANEGDGGVSLLPGQGDGGFGPAQTIALGGSDTRTALAHADFDGDGLPDIAVALEDEDKVALALGEGPGAFGAESRFAVGKNPDALAAADVNGDGLADLIAGNSTSDDLSVLLGDGSGGFEPQRRFDAGDVADVLAADLNDDGLADLVTANGFTEDLSVLLNRSGA